MHKKTMNVPLLVGGIALAATLGMGTQSLLAGIQQPATLGSPPSSNMLCPTTSTMIQVDKPVNTILRDDTGGGATSLEQVYRRVNAQYEAEAKAHPGVNLVAHAIF